MLEGCDDIFCWRCVYNLDKSGGETCATCHRESGILCPSKIRPANDTTSKRRMIQSFLEELESNAPCPFSINGVCELGTCCPYQNKDIIVTKDNKGNFVMLGRDSAAEEATEQISPLQEQGEPTKNQSPLPLKNMEYCVNHQCYHVTK